MPQYFTMWDLHALQYLNTLKMLLLSEMLSVVPHVAQPSLVQQRASQHSNMPGSPH